MRASECGRFVFSAGEDGNIFVFEVVEMQGSISKSARRGTVNKQSNISAASAQDVTSAANLANSNDFTGSGMEPNSIDLASQM